MKKISYSLVFNRKKKLNKKGMALVQVEAYLNRRKMYFSTRVYLKPDQWDVKRRMVKNHPNSDALNRMLYDFIADIEQKELGLWQQRRSISLDSLKDSIEKPENITKNTLKNKDSVRSQMNTPLEERNSIQNSNHELNDNIESEQGESTDNDRPKKRREPRQKRSEGISNRHHRARTTFRMMITTERTATRPTKDVKASGRLL